MNTDWQRSAFRLWGSDWIAPMSEVLDINRRTIERWKAGEGEPNAGLRKELGRLAQPIEARSIGAVLRQLARGETLDDIRANLRVMQIAVDKVADEVGQFQTIAILAAKHSEEAPQ